MQRNATRVPSSHMSRLAAGSMPKPPNSASEDDSPVPNSTLPRDKRSRVAMRSATPAGWLYAGGLCTMPWPSRRSFVRWETAARKTSGAEEWLYSSRKWCSTTQAVWTPMRSASSHCSMASSSTVYSASSSQGRGSWCSKKRPTFIAPYPSGDGGQQRWVARDGDAVTDHRDRREKADASTVRQRLLGEHHERDGDHGG